MWRVPLNFMAVAMSGRKVLLEAHGKTGARVLETEFTGGMRNEKLEP